MKCCCAEPLKRARWNPSRSASGRRAHVACRQFWSIWMVGFSWWWSSPSRPRPTGAVLLLNCSGQFLVYLRSSSSKIVYRELLRLFPAPTGAGKRGGGSLPAHFTRGGALGEPSPREFRTGSPHIPPRRRHFPSLSVSGGWTQRGQCDAPRGEEGGRKARRQGMPREALKPGDLFFPPDLCPRARPSPPVSTLRLGSTPATELEELPRRDEEQGATESRCGDRRAAPR